MSAESIDEAGLLRIAAMIGAVKAAGLTTEEEI